VPERDRPAPRERAPAAIGVDGERVAAELERFGAPAFALDDGLGRDGLEARDEAGVGRVQVLEHDALVLAELLDLLVGRGRVEVARVDVAGHRSLMPDAVVPRAGVAVELDEARRPGRRDGPIVDGIDGVAALGDVGTRGLEVRHRGHAEGVGGRVGADADRVGGVRSARGALPAEGHAREAGGLAEVAVEGEDAVAVHRDGFVDVADEEACHEGGDELPARRVGVADEEDIRARLERGEIAGDVEAAALVVVPVAVDLVGLVLVVREGRLARGEHVGGDGDDSEREGVGPRLPYDRGDPERARGDDVHLAPAYRIQCEGRKRRLCGRRRGGDPALSADF
jgi:hypothetical protein